MSEYICPNCKKTTYDEEALMCVYCGENLERGVGVLGKMKYSYNWYMVAIILIALISIVLITTL